MFVFRVKMESRESQEKKKTQLESMKTNSITISQEEKRNPNSFMHTSQE